MSMELCWRSWDCVWATKLLEQLWKKNEMCVLCLLKAPLVGNSSESGSFFSGCISSLSESPPPSLLTRGYHWEKRLPMACSGTLHLCLVCVSMKLVWTWHFDIPVSLKNVESVWEAWIHSCTYIQVRVYAHVCTERDWRLDKRTDTSWSTSFQLSSLVKQMSCFFKNRLFAF